MFRIEIEGEYYKVTTFDRVDFFPKKNMNRRLFKVLFARYRALKNGV